MLVEISKTTLTDTEKMTALLRGWDAVDIETGAYLAQSGGRTKYGLPKYYLILPHESPTERGGIFGNRKNIFARERSIIRAWELWEAIQVGNKRLPRMIKKAELQLAQRKDN